MKASQSNSPCKRRNILATTLLRRFGVAALLACALGMAWADAPDTFPATQSTRVFYWGAAPAPRFLDANAAASALLITQQSAAYYLCANYVGQPGSPGNCSFTVDSLSSSTTSTQSFTYYQYGKGSNEYYGAGSLSIYTGLENYCPDTSTLSGVTCTCKAGYLKNAKNDNCYQSETVDLLRATKSKNQNSCSNSGFGNPIYPSMGSKKELVDTGLNVGGQALRLVYDSGRQTAATAAAVAVKDFGDAPSFGGLWLSSLHRRLVISPAGFGARLFRGDGTTVSFRYEGGSYITDADSSDQLTRVGSNYRYFDATSKSIETYTSAGQLASLADASGKTLSFTYSSGANSVAPATGYMMQVTDQTGRSLQFEYGLPSGGAAATDGRVSAIINMAGQRITTTYDVNGNLTSLTWEDGKTRQFLYENPLLTWALTGVVDENNSRRSTFSYDSAGRAVSTEYAGGVNRYTVSYGTPPAVAINQVYDASSSITYRYHDWQAPSGVGLTTPNAQSVDLGATVVLGGPVMTSISQPAGSGCNAATSASSYDTRGNVVSKDDFTGQRSCYAYDGSNREITRVEGLANTASCADVLPSGAALPSGSRKTETIWHPDWRSPTKVIQPLLNTSLVYHGQPDPFNGNIAASCAAASALPNGSALPVICKQVEQATLSNGTSDSTSPARITRFTYDATGQVLTHVDPNNKTTSYAYYAGSSFATNGDSNFKNVGLLLHGDGANGSTTFTDSSTIAKTLTRFGSTSISTADAKFGGSSAYFDGVNSYLSIPPSTDLTFATADYTVELWVKFNAVGAFRRLVSSTTSGFAAGTFNLRLTSGNHFYAYSGGAAGVTSSVTVATGVWYHLAVTRQSGMMRLFVDGVLQGSESSSGSTTEPIKSIGGYYAAGNNEYHNGYLDDIRITKGVARYIANFTPPMQAFPNAGPVLDPNAVGHTKGDLQTITNAAGHVSQFTLYDAAGRVRQMIDPKGVVTDTVYTPRGWVSSVTVTPPGGAPRTTSYAYDNAGQLSGVTLPDATSLSYSYDAAHRLIGVTDAKGNSVTYTLDNMGNRVGEQVKDAQGNLQRSITRVYDALNRVQQITGAAN
ncbi:MAG: LamG-like jellyroll fold domain-containing protein [Polaromonas sp.]|nr:LamG-like jellyroll fold domain-containing protein [Polaromonas sp.]MDP3752140.1 LamG-like jellyroll fold domain-containing protein [Polaromonas sp.]